MTGTWKVSEAPGTIHTNLSTCIFLERSETCHRFSVGSETFLCLAPLFLSRYQSFVIPTDKMLLKNQTRALGCTPLFLALTRLLNIWYIMEIIFSSVTLNLVIEKRSFF